MTKFKNLTKLQQIDFIITVQNEVARKFKKYFQSDVISGKEAKRIIEYTLYTFDHLSLGQLKKDVKMDIELFITKKLHPDFDD
jgi:hypothetical protein